VSDGLELTLPSADTSSVRRYSGGALGQRVGAVSGLGVTGPTPEHAADVRAVLARVGPLTRSAPGLVWSALRRPSVYVHLRLAADDPAARSSPERLHTGLATLAVELAVAGALDAPLELRRPPARIVVRSRCVALGIDPAIPLRLAPDGTASQGARPCAEQRSHELLSEAIAMALVDDSPLASLEAHPDKTGSELSLGGADVATWKRALEDALDRIGRALPRVREELELVLSQIVPVGRDEERHLSASYREALGTIYVSLHPDPLTMTEAILHEAQHNKLNAVLTTDRLLENSPDERYASPVRPDPRPLLGVLLAVHAFVPVAMLYAELRAAGEPTVVGGRADARIEAIVQGNAAGLAMLESHALPTSTGRALLEELRRLHDLSATRLERG